MDLNKWLELQVRMRALEVESKKDIPRSSMGSWKTVGLIIVRLLISFGFS